MFAQHFEQHLQQHFEQHLQAEHNAGREAKTTRTARDGDKGYSSVHCCHGILCFFPQGVQPVLTVASCHVVDPRPTPNLREENHKHAVFTS
jgi:hypothetical protein